GTGQQLDTLRLDLEIRGFDSLPVDLDPAAFDIELGLTPGAAHLLGKAFGQAGRFGHVNSGGEKSERAAAEKRTLQLAERGWNYFLLMVIWRDGPCVCPLTPLGIFWISPPAFRNAAICAARDWLVSVAGSGLRLADVVLLAIVLSFPLVNRTGHYTDFVGERSIIRSAAHAASAFRGDGANAARAERPAMVFTQRSGAVSCRASIAGGLHMLSRCLRAALGGVALFASSMAFAQIEHYPSEQGRVSVEEIVGGLAFPWSLAFLPDGKRMLVTERPGRLRLLDLDGELSEPLEGVPKVFASAQGGLLDVRLSPDFEQDRLI